MGWQGIREEVVPGFRSGYVTVAIPKATQVPVQEHPGRQFV